MLYSGHSTRDVIMDRTRNLDEYVEFVYNKLRQDSDNFIVIGGQEGSGKSTFALLLCNAISPGLFDIQKDVVYDAPEYIRRVKTAPRYGSIVADEGGEMFMANDANTREGKAIKKTIQQSRRKNHNTAILAPRNFYLNKTSMFRCHAYFHIYTKNAGGRILHGYGIKYVPVMKVWQDGRRPWFEKAFHFRFPDIKEIDREAWELYTRIKNERGDGRLDKYADEIEEENEVKPELTSEQIADMVDDMKLSEQMVLRNTRGRFDADAIYERFKDIGATYRMSKAAALDLNNRMLPI